MECTEFFKKKITVMNGVMCVLVVILHSYNMERYLRIMNEGGTTEQFVPDLE